MNGTDVDANGDPTNNVLPVGSGYPNLLLFANKSDVCLRCHYGSPGSYHVWTDAGPNAPGAMKSGGNFVFLEEDNINDAHAGASNPIPGYSAGHTVLSGIAGNDPEGVNTFGPGAGTVVFPTSELGCSSCHDPHGNDSFRLLYKTGQQISYNGGTSVLTWAAEIEAEAISVFSSENANNYNYYLDGYSAWCSSCHEAFHEGWPGEFIHPSGSFMGGDTVASYNSYRGTTNCVAFPPTLANPQCGDGSNDGDAYYYLTPLQDTSFATTGPTAGATGTSQVVCVSCHRSHATSAPDAGRWDFNVTFLDEDGDESGSYELPRLGAVGTYADANQRSMCNKCHGKDEFDELLVP